MDLGRVLRERLRQAFQSAPEPEGAGPANGAAAENVITGRITSVYSDAHFTIIGRDGDTEIIRHDEPPAQHDEYSKWDRVHSPDEIVGRRTRTC